MIKPLERHQVKATQVIDLTDVYSRDRRVNGQRPRPFGKIQFFIAARIAGGVREDFVTALELQTIVNPSGYHLFFGTYLLPDGSKRAGLLADGQYVMRVYGQYYQPNEHTDFSIPMPNPNAPLTIDLEAGYAYPFPNLRGHALTLLYGKVQDAAEDGLAQITVTVEGEDPSYWTDQSGQWVLIFHDDWLSDTVTLRFTLPDGTSQTLNDVLVEAGRTNSVPAETLPG